MQITDNPKQIIETCDWVLEEINLLIELGGLAQLVERLLCKQDVSGSSPLTSICGTKYRVR